MITTQKSSPSSRTYFGAPRDNSTDQREVYAEPEQAFFEEYSLPDARLYEKLGVSGECETFFGVEYRMVCLISRGGK